MKNSKFPWRAVAIILILSVLLTTALTGCETYGKKQVLSKEELTDNVTRDAGFESFVCDYLDRWDFPRFDGAKLKRVELIFREAFYLELADAKALADKTAAHFLENYYDTVDLTNQTALTDALITSYVAAIGDKYSRYRTAEEYEAYETGLSGFFVGIGVSVMKDEDSGLIRIIEVIEGGGAEEAGILVGDLISSVDGKEVNDKDVGYEKALNMVRGEEGTTVSLTILRGDEEISLVVLRRLIEQKSIKYSLTDGIGYIEIKSFDSNTDEQFIDAIDYMEENGAVGVIYDLRNNTGGYLSSVLNMLSRIAPKGTTLAKYSNGYDDDDIDKTEESFLVPSVVLCNEWTASASELFTSAIRDFGEMELMKETVVGTITLGKGVMQTTYFLSDASAITLTVAYYSSPLGINYHLTGIAPDITVELGDEGDAQLEAAKAAINELVNK